MTATNAERLSTSAQVVITVQAARPAVVALTAPVNDATYLADSNVRFTASAADPQATAVPDKAIAWSADGTRIGGGATIDRADLAVGNHL